MQLREYAVRLNDLEKAGKSAKQDLRTVYKSVLTEYPYLEGFWVRWAHSEFRMEGTDTAIEVFEKALQTNKYSLIIWVNYLRFVLRITNPSNDRLAELFGLAEPLIGSHFWSHEFWDLQLEWREDKVDLLCHLLHSKTLHQFSKYYAQLVTVLDTASTAADLHQFRFFLPEIDSIQVAEDELGRFREVILSKMRLQYELHLRRVTNAMHFEKQIKRPFYYPKPVLDTDIAAWCEYAEKSDDPLMIYRRALIPCADDYKMWLAYIRCLMRLNVGDEEIRDAYESCKLPEVRAHYELWQASQAPAQPVDDDSIQTLIDKALCSSPLFS